MFVLTSVMLWTERLSWLLNDDFEDVMTCIWPLTQSLWHPQLACSPGQRNTACDPVCIVQNIWLKILFLLLLLSKIALCSVSEIWIAIHWWNYTRSGISTIAMHATELFRARLNSRLWNTSAECRDWRRGSVARTFSDQCLICDWHVTTSSNNQANISLPSLCGR